MYLEGHPWCVINPVKDEADEVSIELGQGGIPARQSGA